MRRCEAGYCSPAPYDTDVVAGLAVPHSGLSALHGELTRYRRMEMPQDGSRRSHERLPSK